MEEERALEVSLTQGLDALGWEVSPAQRRTLLDYVALLVKWNRVYNLTAIRLPQDMVVHHVLDSLSVLPYGQGPRILDVGSGAGLPGIPWAIVLPEVHFVLLDSATKKVRFLIQAIHELELRNVEAVHSRIEDYRPVELHDTVVSRAFSRLKEFIECAGRVCRPGGALLAMKGRYPGEEVVGISAEYQVEKIVEVTVPQLNKQRHIVCIRRLPGVTPP